jgi:nicotinate-nucleotide pyrophosphorylase (carboxylating)
MLDVATSRQQRLERALCRGAQLTLDNLDYRGAVRAIIEALLRADQVGTDITATALQLKNRDVTAIVSAREKGLVAGLAESAFLFESQGIEAELARTDGDAVEPGTELMRLRGEESKLLSLERTALNLLQRMSGIATAVRSLQEKVSRGALETKVVGTRKTPWGLLDKRALHVGNGGTHRLSLGDAIVIKNNHLTLLAAREDDAAPIAIEKAWPSRSDSAFIEVEVRGEEAARAAAQRFRGLRAEASDDYPCLLMLDNMSAENSARIIDVLRRENLWDDTLIEASGGITEGNIESHAASGVDAISVGSLTHSVRALDISQRIS